MDYLVALAGGAALASDAEPSASDAFGTSLLWERFAAAPSPTFGPDATG